MRTFPISFPSLINEFVELFDGNLEPNLSLVKDKEWYLEYEMSGLKRDKIDVRVNSQTININLEDRKGYKYNRKYRTPEQADYKNTVVKYEDGILTIIIPRIEIKKQEDSIQVKVT